MHAAIRGSLEVDMISLLRFPAALCWHHADVSDCGAGTAISLNADPHARRPRWRQPGEGKPWRGGSRTASMRRLQML